MPENESICNFLPPKKHIGEVNTVHFVYETEFHKLKRPLLPILYHVYLVTGGSASFSMCDREYEVEVGDVFFDFSGCPYTICGDADFRYMYISFMGAGVPDLLAGLRIGFDAPVYKNMGHLLDFWFSSISRVNRLNASLVAESVLLYTLSYIAEEEEKPVRSRADNLFSMVADYVDTHYTDPDLSLTGVAAVFSYTEKYISYLFKKNMRIGFGQYVENLRIQRAHELIAAGEQSVTHLAYALGYRDALYFSKVFKKRMGKSPRESMQRRKT